MIRDFNDAASTLVSVPDTERAQENHHASIVFVDSHVPDAEALLKGLEPGTEVFWLRPDQDGLKQMVDVLAGRSGIDAIHIISHGSPAAVQLGATTLNAQNLQTYAHDLAVIGSALATDADILLYGCDVAAGSNGAAFVEALAQATQSDIAASTDLTGAAALGGNWTLESRSGSIEAALPLSEASIAGYRNTLGTFNFESVVGYAGAIPVVTDTVDGITMSATNEWDGWYRDWSVHDANGFGGTSGRVLYSSYDRLLDRFVFDHPINLYSFQLASGVYSESLVFTPIGGFGDGAFTVNTSTTGAEVTPHWFNIREFTVEKVGGGWWGNVLYDNFVFEPYDRYPPVISYVVSNAPDRAYKVGDVIDILVIFNEDVFVTGTPQLTLETGAADRVIDYVGGGGSSLIFRYTVQAGDTSADLDYLSADALKLNGGTIRDAADYDAVLTLAAPGSSGSLGYFKALVIDGVAPAMPVISAIATDSAAAGNGITNDNTLTLSGTAEAHTTVTVFRSDVGAMGTIMADGSGNWTYDYTSTALADGSYTFTVTATDAAGNASAASAGMAVTIDTTAPQVSSARVNGAMITLTFAEKVYASTADGMAVTVNGTARAINAVAGSGTTTLTLTLASAVESGQTVTFDYDPTAPASDLLDMAGNELAALVAKAVTGNTSPTISSGASGSINENAPSFTVVYTAAAIDAEGDPVAFSLSGADADSFTIDNSTGEVHLRSPADYEGKSTYSIDVVASDGIASTAKAVAINVIDVNDAPSMVNFAARGLTSTDASTNASVGRLSAVDQDTGDTHMFSLVAGDGSNDADNGKFRIMDDLLLVGDSRLAGGTYHVLVRATDQGGGFVNQALTITVSATNAAPVIGSLASGSISENDSPFQPCYQVFAGDLDDDPITFSVSGADAAYFQVWNSDSRTGYLRLLSPADYEVKNTYSINVVASDGIASTAKAVTINVIDVNDAPSMVSLTGSSLTSAIASATATVGSLSAVDQDAGDTHTFSLATGDGSNDADNGKFAISGNTLLVGDSRLTAGTYHVLVRATDQGGGFINQALTVSVSPSNVPPTISSGASGSVNENAPYFIVVYTAAATEVDGNPVTFSLSGADAGSFTINSSTGEMCLNASADYEIKNAYSVDVVASNGIASSTKAVTISVADVNDGPTMVNLTGGNLTSDTASASATVGTLSAVDQDVGDTHTYSLALGNGSNDADNGKFTVSGNTLRVGASPLAAGTYHVVVRATDQGGFYVNKAQTITVSPANVPPTITSGATVSITENASAATVVYTAAATDGDGNPVSFSLSGADAGSFTINSSTGVVQLTSPADYEVKNVYDIDVVASDGTASSTKAVYVYVIDTNEAPSNVLLSSSSVAEDTSTASALTIGTLTSDDPDSSGTFTYAIVGGADATDFVISGNQLQLKAGTSLDYEMKSAYDVTVRTTDQGGLSYDKALTVSVTNVNEKPVITAPAAQNVSLATATAITGISVADPDAGSNPITVSLSAPVGTFTATTGGGVVALGDGTGSLTLVGTQTNINTFIAASKVTYIPPVGATGSITLSIGANDGGNTGSGGTQTDSRTETLNIVPVAPVITAVTTDSATAGDGITNDNTLTLSGTAEANSTVEIYHSGAGSLGTVTADGSGNWAFDYTVVTLADGSHTFTATATDAIGNTSAASAGFAVTIDTTAPSAPATLAVTAASDSGIASTDGITSDTTPAITGTAEAGATVTLYDTDGTTVLGTAVATGGSWSITSSALGEGSHTLTAKATDTAGNASTASAGLAVTIDTTAPLVSAASVNGATLTLTFAEKVSAGTADGMTVTVNGTARAISAVAGSGTTTLTLTLASAVEPGQTVTFDYDPTAASSELLDVAGNELAALVSKAVTNATAAPYTGPVVVPPATTTVDGVPLQVATVTNADGSTSQVITVPVVTNTRTDSVGNNTVADIPLVSSGGTSLLSAQVPAGFGLTVSGSPAPKGAGSSLADLIREINAHTSAGSADQTSLADGGSGFLQGLAANAPLLVQTIVPTVAPNAAPAAPLVISGTPAAPGTPTTALVIDARSLPSSTVIQLQHVDFAAIVGTVRVTGGDGAQHVWGDSSNQYIMLGADDDVLHGGAGNDTVGSAGGNDQIFGDDGDDLVFGGAGNDLIDGGTGNDVVRLAGAGRADYQLRVENGQLVATHRNGGADGTDTLAHIETLRFAGTQADTSANGTVTRLYDALFERAPDQGGLHYWLSQHEQGVALHDIAAAFLGSAEAQNLHGSLGDAAYVDLLYRSVHGRTADVAGRSFWLDALASGKADRAGVLLSFIDSPEKLAAEADTQHDQNFSATDVASLVRIYDTLFDRAPDQAGLNYWIAASEAGVALRDIAGEFAGSGEVQARYGALDNAAFIATLYRVGLGRAGSGDEVAAWAHLLDAGQLTRGDALLGFADSAEKVALVGVITTSIETVG